MVSKASHKTVNIKAQPMMSESTGNDIRIVVIASCAAAAGGFAWLMTQGISIPNAIVIALCGGAMLCGVLILGSDGWL